MKNLVVLFIGLILSGSAHSALIDNGSFTSDNVSGLDWLDLNNTINMSYTDALANNTGWRYATNDEVVNLFNLSFPDFVPNAAGADISDPGAGPVYANQTNDIIRFDSFFGPGVAENFGPPLLDYPDQDLFFYNTFGLYQNNIGELQIMGNSYSDIVINNIQQFSLIDSNSTIIGISGTGNSYEQYRSGATNSTLSTYLVRESSVSIVPVPSAILLFGSGLACLIRLSTYKRS